MESRRRVCFCLALFSNYVRVWLGSIATRYGSAMTWGIVTTVNHLVMGSRWPSYALPTLGRQARQARTHDFVSDYTIWNVEFATLIFTDDWGKSVEFQRRIISMYPYNARDCPFHSKQLNHLFVTAVTAATQIRLWKRYVFVMKAWHVSAIGSLSRAYAHWFQNLFETWCVVDRAS